MHMVFREIKITAAVVSIVLCLSAFQEKYKTRSSFFLGFILLHSLPPLPFPLPTAVLSFFFHALLNFKKSPSTFRLRHADPYALRHPLRILHRDLRSSR